MTWSEKLSQYKLISPTSLTILRGILALTLPFFFYSQSPSAHFWGMMIFIIAAVTDFLDGWLARKWNQITDLGKILDPTTDKMLILISLYVFASLGYFSPWWLVPIFIREIAVTFCRVGWLLEGKAIAAEQLGKWKFGLQVALIGCSIIILVGGDHNALGFLESIGRFLLYPALISAMILTVISGVTFVTANKAHFDSLEFRKFLCAYGVGFFSFAPGTWGSLVGLLFVLLVCWNTFLYILLFLALLALGHWSAAKLDYDKEKDPGFVVSDEVCGILVTFFLIPINFSSIVTGFCLFRLMDIVKPPPCRQLERMKGYWGILNDDLMAGVYSWLILYIAFGLV